MNEWMDEWMNECNVSDLKNVHLVVSTHEEAKDAKGNENNSEDLLVGGGSAVFCCSFLLLSLSLSPLLFLESKLRGWWMISSFQCCFFVSKGPIGPRSVGVKQ
jgi:hypothetical protein